MNNRLLLLVTLVLGVCSHVSAADRLRVLVLTDIENEPDDAMSMVRFLTYCNQWDVEGLVATTSVHQRNRTASARIRQIVEAYGKVRGNLLIHEPGYQWFHYGEPGTFTVANARTGAPLEIEDADKMDAWFTVPARFGKAGTMHVILAVTDNGTPPLTRYQRVIVTVNP